MSQKTRQLSARFEVRIDGRPNRIRYTERVASAFGADFRAAGERVRIIEHRRGES